VHHAPSQTCSPLILEWTAASCYHSRVVAESKTNVKILGPTSLIRCDHMNCVVLARFLFRAGAGRISAYCEYHAKDAAELAGVPLPNPRLLDDLY
jgi:hypothetical protein